MLTPVNLQRKLTSAFTDRQATLLTEVIHDAYSDLVHTGDFNELKDLVRQVVVLQVETGYQIKELTVAQQRTEQRVEELAVAQQRTEQRVEELAVAQQRTEQRVEELAVAQQRTEQRVGELTVAQKDLATAQQRTEQRLEELTVAQKELTVSQRDMQLTLQALTKQVGGLSDRFGGGIEEAAVGIVYFVLTTDLDWKVEILEAGWHKWGDVEVEIDLYGQIFDPQLPDTKIWLFGEAKFNITTREVERFAAKVKRVQAQVEGELYPVLFSYRLRPEVLDAIQKAGLHYIGSNGRMK